MVVWWWGLEEYGNEREDVRGKTLIDIDRYDDNEKQPNNLIWK